MTDYLIENLRGMCAHRRHRGGQCLQSGAAREDYCTVCEAAARLASPSLSAGSREQAQTGTPTALQVEQAVYLAYIETRESLAVPSLSPEARKRGEVIMDALKLTRRFLFKLAAGAAALEEKTDEARTIARIAELLRDVERHCPCGARPETPNHPSPRWRLSC